MDRDTQIELIRDAERRAKSYLRHWLAKPEFMAAIYRDAQAQHDDDHDGKSHRAVAQ